MVAIQVVLEHSGGKSQFVEEKYSLQKYRYFSHQNKIIDNVLTTLAATDANYSLHDNSILLNNRKMIKHQTKTVNNDDNATPELRLENNIYSFPYSRNAS